MNLENKQTIRCLSEHKNISDRNLFACRPYQFFQLKNKFDLHHLIRCVRTIFDNGFVQMIV